MADNSYNPTAANILASLKIRGASVEGGSAAKAGYVPVLGADGKLDSSTIPIEAISSHLAIPPLPDVAVVDCNATGIAATGSIVAPFKTLEAAAAAGYTNFLLMGGYFGDATINQVHNSIDNLKVRIFSVGSSKFNNLRLYGYHGASIFEFYNITAASVTFGAGVNSCTAVMLGKGSVGTLNAAEETVLTVYTDSTVSIETINPPPEPGAISVEYLDSSDRVKNDSSVAGSTVSDALDRVETRKIRIPKFSGDATGLHADDHEDVSGDGSTNTYILDSLGTRLVSAINGVFHKNGDSPTYNVVTATKVAAPTVVATALTSGEVKFGTEADVKATVKVDVDNFLTIA